MKLMFGLAVLFATTAFIVLMSAHALQAWQTTAVGQMPNVDLPAKAASSYWYGRPQ